MKDYHVLSMDAVMAGEGMDRQINVEFNLSQIEQDMICLLYTSRCV